ncbi:MAG: histidinol-phosphatase [Ruminococcus sp.]|nr:histidinol-phosphatase [Ruminococcus sp.]
MLLANYHTHTTRCRHAIGEDRYYVEDAIESGKKVLGFSDHCPWIFPKGYVSGTRMKPSDLDDYFSSLLDLKREYAKDITIYIGFESEYIPEMMAEQEKLLADYPIDYMILGEHFLQSETTGAYMGNEPENEAEFIRYIDYIIEGMETGKYRYVAHPDLCPFSKNPACYTDQYLRLCRYLKAHEIPVEINLLGVVEKRHYTSDSFLDIAAKVGCSAIIGCDAHSPDRLQNAYGEKLCKDMAERHHLPLIDFLPGLEALC